MKYFDFDGEYLTPKCSQYYHIDIARIPHYYSDSGKHEWFPHLAEKNWFTEEMFWELVEFSKKQFPDVNFDKAIWQTAKEFAFNEVHENFDYHQMLHDLTKRNNG